MDATANPYGRGDAPEVSTLRASEAHLLELRKIHSMLHSAMDALIKDLNANEAARLLILLDDRLTSLINAADVEREPETASVRSPAKPSVTMPSPAPFKGAPPAATSATEPAARVDRPSPSWRQPPPPSPAPSPVPVPDFAEPSARTSDAPKADEPPSIPSEPILAVPPAAEPSLSRETQIPSFENMIASAAKANLAAPQPSEFESVPEIEAAPDAPAEFSTSAEAPRGDDERPAEGVSDLEPATAGDEAEQQRDDEPEWIEEDLEDGADLREEAERARPNQGLAGRLLSRFRLPGLGRRPATAADDLAPSGDARDHVEALPDDEDDAVEEVPEAAPVIDPKIGRLHTAADQLASGQILDEAAQRTGNRIELRKVELGLDLVVKGLPRPLGTVRIAESDGHVLYHPGFGLDLPNREPNRVDLEIWMKAMGDMVVRVLEDIGRRRKGSDPSGSGSGEGV